MGKFFISNCTVDYISVPVVSVIGILPLGETEVEVTRVTTTRVQQRFAMFDKVSLYMEEIEEEDGLIYELHPKISLTLSVAIINHYIIKNCYTV